MSLVMTNIQPHEYLDALNEVRQFRQRWASFKADLAVVVNDLHNGTAVAGGVLGDQRSIAAELTRLVQRTEK